MQINVLLALAVTVGLVLILTVTAALLVLVQPVSVFVPLTEYDAVTVGVNETLLL
jgi:hypothetical protein